MQKIRAIVHILGFCLACLLVACGAETSTLATTTNIPTATTKAGDPKQVLVTVLPEEKYPFKIISAAADKGKFIRFDIKDVKKEDRDAYEITVENTKTTKGRYFDTIKLKIDSDVRQNLDIWVFGNIQ